MTTAETSSEPAQPSLFEKKRNTGRGLYPATPKATLGREPRRPAYGTRRRVDPMHGRTRWKQGQKEGTELGDALARVATGISEDAVTLERIKERLGIGRERVKAPLAIGIEGKKVLWANLRDFADVGTRLPDVDFEDLIERASHQRAELESFRMRAGRETLGSG